MVTSDCHLFAPTNKMLDELKYASFTRFVSLSLEDLNMLVTASRLRLNLTKTKVAWLGS